MLALSILCLWLSALYASVTLGNLAVFRAPRPPREAETSPAISVLIPARNEARNIADAIDSALDGAGPDIEILVLDDGSDDGTARIVEARAQADPRVKLLHGHGLPPGWNGKQHACWTLARAARHPVLLFIDADVRLSAGAPARMAAYLQRRRLDLVSGFPRQRTETLAEKLVIPQIFVLLLGYLPLPLARLFRGEGFGAGCGQLMMVRKAAYERAGGHAQIRTTMHDGLLLPRLMRRAGGRTDLVDATPLATCRMYESWAEVWAGFGKNATEGMAKPVALPVWTILLLGGHVLPYLLVVASWMTGDAAALAWSLAALGLLLTARLLTALIVRQSAVSVALHPVAICIVLAIQWNALVGAGRNAKRTWRGRTYDAG